MAASQTVKIPEADHQKLSPSLEAGFESHTRARIIRSPGNFGARRWRSPGRLACKTYGEAVKHIIGAAPFCGIDTRPYECHDS